MRYLPNHPGPFSIIVRSVYCSRTFCLFKIFFLETLGSHLPFCYLCSSFSRIYKFASFLRPSIARLLLFSQHHLFEFFFQQSHVGRGAPLRVQGRRRSFQDLSPAGWSHPQKWIHCHQGQTLQGSNCFHSDFPILTHLFAHLFA